MKKIITIILYILFSTAVAISSEVPNSELTEMEQPTRRGPDLQMIAQELGIDVETLEEAISTEDPRNLTPESMAIIAEKLGISKERFMELMSPKRQPREMGMSMEMGPDLGLVSQKLDIPLELLIKAFETPEPQNPDFLKNIAIELGVEEEALKDALGPPPMQEPPISEAMPTSTEY